MTLKNSSNSKILLHSFIGGIMACLPVGVFLLIGLLLSIPVAIYTKLLQIGPDAIGNIGYDPNKNTSDPNMFLLVRPGFQPIIQVIIVLSAILLGVIAFNFLFKKNSVNVYLSLGISRKELFLTRFLSGAVLLFIPIILSLLVSYFINLSILTSSHTLYLTQALIYCTLGYLLQAFVCYVLTVLVCMVVGTLIDAIYNSLTVLGGFSIITLSINFITNFFLFGNSFYLIRNYHANHVNVSIFELSYIFNPAMFFYDLSLMSGSYSKDGSNDIYWSLIKNNFTNPKAALFSHIPVLIVWTLIAALLVFVSLKLFQKRKAEIAGNMGVSNILGFVRVFVASIFTFSAMLFTIDAGLNQGVAIFLAIFAAVFVYIITDFTNTLSVTKVFTGLLKLPLVWGITGLIFLTITTSIFGTYNKTPEVGNVKEAFISYQGSPDYVNYYGSSGSDFEKAYDFDRLAFYEKSDISTILNLQNSIINSGRGDLTRSNDNIDPNSPCIGAEIRFEYKLKNGQILRRSYDRISLNTLKNMLVLDNTQAVKDQILLKYSYQPSFELFKRANKKEFDSLIFMNSKERDQLILTRYLGRISIIGSKFIYLNNPFFTNPVETNTSEEFRKELSDAFLKDLLNQSIQDRYLLNKNSIGMIVFRNEPYNETNTFHYDSYGSNTIYLTENFKNTIKLLKKYNYIKYFEFDNKIEEIYAEPYIFNSSDFNFVKNRSRYFKGGVSQNTGALAVQEIQYGNYAYSLPNVENILSKTSPSKAEFDQLLKGLRTNYFITEPGYYIQLKFKDIPRASVFFLPLKDAPDFVKNFKP